MTKKQTAYFKPYDCGTPEPDSGLFMYFVRTPTENIILRGHVEGCKEALEEYPHSFYNYCIYEGHDMANRKQGELVFRSPWRSPCFSIDFCNRTGKKLSRQVRNRLKRGTHFDSDRKEHIYCNFLFRLKQQIYPEGSSVVIPKLLLWTPEMSSLLEEAGLL